MDNANSREYLQKILDSVLENMRRTVQAPSVQQTDIPGKSLGMDDDEEAEMDDLDDDMNPDTRKTQHRSDKHIEHNGELEDSDDDMDEAGRPTRLPGRNHARARMNYRGIMDVGQDSGVETGSGMGTPQQGSSLPDDDMNMDPADTENPSPAQQNGSAAMSGAQSPAPAANDEDVTMGDAEPANGTTEEVEGAPLSPPPEPVASAAEAIEAAVSASAIENEAVLEEMKAEDAAIKAEEEGRMEREIVNAEGEANTEAAKEADNVEDP